MDASAWTVIGATIVLLAAIGASFRSLRGEMRAEMRDLRGRIDAQGEDLRQRIDALGTICASKSVSCANEWLTSRACSKASVRPSPASASRRTHG